MALRTSTSVSRRQYGLTKPSAHLRSRSSRRAMSGGLRRHYEEIRGGVAVERDRSHVLIARRVVQIDGVAGVVDVEDLPVRAGFEGHARTPRKLGAPRDTMILEIERPELIVADLVHEAVAHLPSRRHREA